MTQSLSKTASRAKEQDAAGYAKVGTSSSVRRDSASSRDSMGGKGKRRDSSGSVHSVTSVSSKCDIEASIALLDG
jgi:hypothetical protein